MLLWVSLSGIIGIIIWEAIKGVAGTVTASFEVFVAASVGATASMIGFALFALVLGLLGPILAVVYEEWIWVSIGIRTCPKRWSGGGTCAVRS